ncbi:MAG: hypothetical protein BWY32_02080 [bacterium ADurb.Bin243]|nr:MAG: hypothetical protein BWY32_02080 [bacterium ADurb.Bin243]HOD40239.1 hypothetical protein [Candidatus Wallbacteria bacterium]
MKINKIIRFFLLAAVLSVFSLFAQPAVWGAETALDDSELVILRPHKTGPSDTLVYMKDSADQGINKILRENPEFVKQIRIYQNMQKEKFIGGLKSGFKLSDSQLNKIMANYKPDPVYIVLNEGMVDSVSFATNKPFGVLEVSSGGKTSLSVKAAPIVTLSADTINELKTGDRWGYETVCHEIGHVMMYPTHGLVRYPHDFSENIIEKIKKEGHWKNKVTTPVFAMLEGWAEFNGAFFTGRPIGDYTKIDGRAKTEDELSRTEGLVAKIMLDISMDPTINPDKDKGFAKITDTMRNHKCRTLNSFLVDYIKDYPQDKAAVEKIVSANTGGVLKIDYNYGFKDWWADKKQDLKKTFGVVKEWFGGLFKKKEPAESASSSAAAMSSPAKGRPLLRDSQAAEDSAVRAGALKATEKRRLLYEEYKNALAADDAVKAANVLEEIKNLDAGAHGD